MASQNLNVGTTANDSTGDGLRTAFINVRKMFAEIYGITYTSDTLDISGTTFGVSLAQIADQAANTVIVRDANSEGDLSAKAVTDQQILIGDGTGFTAAALSGDVTMTNAGAVTIGNDKIDSQHYVDGSIDTAHIANDNVTHDKLEARYTAINAIGTTSGAFDINFSLGAIHTVTLGGGHTGTFTNFKIGQVVDIVITGNHTLTFDATSSGTAALRRVGSTEYDGSKTNLIQVVCASDDSTTPIFYYTVNEYATDTQP